MLRDESYVLQSGNRPGTHKIGAHRPGIGTSRYGSAFPVSSPNMYPLMYMDAMSNTTMGAVLAYIESGLSTGPQYKLLGVRSTEWLGKPVAEVKFEGAMGIVNRVYLDRANDLAFLGFETGADRGRNAANRR